MEVIKISGRVDLIFPLQEGVSASGKNWKRAEYLIETLDMYPRKVKFSVRNDDVDKYPLVAGQIITAYVNIESREWNQKWYTEITAWKVENYEQPQLAVPQSVQQPSPQQYQQSPFQGQPAYQQTPSQAVNQGAYQVPGNGGYQGQQQYGGWQHPQEKNPF